MSVGSSSSEWQPIETAPRGRKVIVSVPGGSSRHHRKTMMGRYWPTGTLEVAEGFEGEDWAVEVNGEFYMPEGWYEECEVDEAPAHNIAPTHWMPLPPPPGQSGLHASQDSAPVVSGLQNDFLTRRFMERK